MRREAPVPQATSWNRAAAAVCWAASADAVPLLEDESVCRGSIWEVAEVARELCSGPPISPRRHRCRRPSPSPQPISRLPMARGSSLVLRSLPIWTRLHPQAPVASEPDARAQWAPGERRTLPSGLQSPPPQWTNHRCDGARAVRGTHRCSSGATDRLYLRRSSWSG